MPKNGNIHPTRIFKSPHELEVAWKLYKENIEVESEKWFKVQYVGKEGERKTDKYKVPYTFEGFSIFCYNNYGIIHQYFTNKGNIYDDFMDICSHIKEEIRHDQITGGMLGIYNPSITQRLNSLVEKVETKIDASIEIDFTD